MFIFTVPSSCAPLSAKDFLRKHAGVSLTLWRKIKQADQFYINQQKATPALSMIKPGDTIAYTLPQTSSIQPIDLPLNIAYEDDYLIVLDKPAGQLVHPTTKERTFTLANGVLSYYAKKQIPYAFHPVHRLDKDTSGLVLIAKMPQIQHQLSISGKQFQRRYQAIVPGRLNPAQGLIRAPIARLPGSIIERTVSPDGQDAITHYKTLRQSETLSLIELELETGRTHQIRVHLAHIGHPLLGDDLYGGEISLIGRQALHAVCLEFTHPVSGKIICLNSKLPEDIQYIVNFF